MLMCDVNSVCRKKQAYLSLHPPQLSILPSLLLLPRTRQAATHFRQTAARGSTTSAVYLILMQCVRSVRLSKLTSRMQLPSSQLRNTRRRWNSTEGALGLGGAWGGEGMFGEEGVFKNRFCFKLDATDCLTSSSLLLGYRQSLTRPVR